MPELSDPERLALAYIVDEERKTLTNLARRNKLAALISRLADVGSPLALSQGERADLAYRARREIETNRYPAPHIEPLRTAFLKLAPADTMPVSPKGPRRANRR
jgi:hypothetical protein